MTIRGILCFNQLVRQFPKDTLNYGGSKVDIFVVFSFRCEFSRFSWEIYFMHTFILNLSLI